MTTFRFTFGKKEKKTLQFFQPSLLLADLLQPTNHSSFYAPPENFQHWTTTTTTTTTGDSQCMMAAVASVGEIQQLLQLQFLLGPLLFRRFVVVFVIGRFLVDR